MEPPIAQCFWVEPGKLLAGHYPGHREIDVAECKLRWLLEEQGIGAFVDLTRPSDGLKPYEHILRRIGGHTVRWGRFLVKDEGIPTRGEMINILNYIDDQIALNRAVYLHCWGGHGRTGTVAGCWLARHTDLFGQAVIDRLNELWKDTPKGRKGCVTPSKGSRPSQHEFVRTWHEDADAV